MARLVLVLALIGGVSAATTRVLYNSSDLSYLSNGIQFPVPRFDDPVLDEIEQEDLPDMEWMGRLYNHHRWERYLGVLPDGGCKMDMRRYLAALLNGTSWAAKSQSLSLVWTYENWRVNRMLQKTGFLLEVLGKMLKNCGGMVFNSHAK